MESNTFRFPIVDDGQRNPSSDDCDGDHDVHPKCLQCGVRYDHPDLVFVIHDTRCVYYNAIEPQVSPRMGDNLLVRARSVSQLCIG